MAMIRRAWDALPSGLQELLLIGSIGGGHLRKAACTASGMSKESGLGPLIHELLRAAWGKRPSGWTTRGSAASWRRAMPPTGGKGLARALAAGAAPLHGGGAPRRPNTGL